VRIEPLIQLPLGILVTALAALGQSFEVASIKLHPPAVDQPLMKEPVVNPVRVSGTRVDLQMVTLKDLVMAAYNMKEYQVSGGVPSWASRLDSVFDISARAPGENAPSMEEVRPMLQNLLAARFKLKLRRESKQLPVYNLVVAKNGPKLKRVTEETPPAPGMRRGSMEQLAALLSLMVGRPVIDKTGLAGIYEYSNALTLLDVGAPDSAEVSARALTAIQDQLGLRAEPAKAMLETLVIVSAEKPSEN